ncbi:MAG: hypothetical protein WCP73_10655, partial [Eubacteriales bacterium]
LKQSPANVLNLGLVPMVNPNVICTVHTSGYASNMGYAQSIVGYVGAKLAQYNAQLTQAQKDDVNAKLAALQTIINNPLSSDEQLATSANAAKAAIDNAVSAISAATSKPAATPTPSASAITQ